MYNDNILMKKKFYYWPAHPDDPQGIRVASVIEFSVCLSVCSGQIFEFLAAVT